MIVSLLRFYIDTNGDIARRKEDDAKGRRLYACVASKMVLKEAKSTVSEGWSLTFLWESAGCLPSSSVSAGLRPMCDVSYR